MFILNMSVNYHISACGKKKYLCNKLCVIITVRTQNHVFIALTIYAICTTNVLNRHNSVIW